MKAFSDEELQKMLEQNEFIAKGELSPEQQKEVDAYNFLFRELEKEPSGGLSYGFSAKVVSKIEVKKSFISDIKVYVFAAILLVLSIAGTYYLSSYLGHPLTVHIVWPYKWILIFVSITLVLVQYLDQKMIKRFKI